MYSSGEELPQDLPFRIPIRRESGVKRAAFLVRLYFARKLFPCINGPTVRMFRGKLVKAQPRITITEALTMDFVSRHTSIPVPRIYDVFVARRGRNQDVLHIITEYSTGTELEQAWPQMTMEDRRDIIRQLRTYLAELRRLKPPHPGAVEAVYGLPCQSPLIRSRPFGPFPNVKAFQKFLGTEHVQNHSEEHQAKVELDRTALRTYTTMFTHGDIAPRNILVKDNKIVAIVDWETAGWYPEYWEYTRTYMANTRHPEFWEMFKTEGLEIIYPDELAMDRATCDEFFQG